MSIYDVFHLLGGLALFLFGMSVMSDSLEKRAGRRLKAILEQLTSSPFKAALLGLGVTAIIQSSSATTVMVVGFVNSGIMQLKQAIGVVMGANIGTTVTAWILSLTGITSDSFWVSLLKPSTFTPLLAFIGIAMLLFGKRHRDTAGILLGFSVLMYGMETMSAAVNGLSKDPAFVNTLMLFSNPLFGVLAGAVVTAIIQSSSASIGILQAIANTGSLTFGAAIPIIMGQNIGTCITAVLSAIGANRGAKRVAVVHLMFNLMGTAVFLPLFYVLYALLGLEFMNQPINAFYIAVSHSAFNIMTTAMSFPFINFLEMLAYKVISEDRKGERPVLLDERLLSTPSIAIEQSRRLTARMAAETHAAFLKADALLEQYDAVEAEKVVAIENKVDQYEDELSDYLVKVSAQNMSDDESRDVSKLLHSIDDLERICDHAINISESAQELHEKDIQFSPEATQQMRVIRAAVREILDMAVNAFIQNDIALAKCVEPLEEVVDLLRTNIRQGHIERLRTGACTIELGFVLGDLLTNLERVSDHCSNIATAVIEIEMHGSVDAHAYQKSLRSGEAGARFQQEFDAYLKKYDLNAEFLPVTES